MTMQWCVFQSLIDEFSLRVGQQAVVLVATPGKNTNNFKVGTYLTSSFTESADEDYDWKLLKRD